MSMFNGAERDQKMTQEIHSILDKRKRQYGSVSVKTVLVENEEGWKNSITRIEALHRDQ